jgi:hypothetical protein
MDPIITTQAQHGGAACPGRIEQSCNTNPCPVDCKYTWGEWGACSVPCGSGTQQRSANINSQPQHGGAACPGPQTQACNNGSCGVIQIGNTNRELVFGNNVINTKVNTNSSYAVSIYSDKIIANVNSVQQPQCHAKSGYCPQMNKVDRLYKPQNPYYRIPGVMSVNIVSK